MVVSGGSVVSGIAVEVVVVVVAGAVVEVVAVDGGISLAVRSRGTDCGRPVTSAPTVNPANATAKITSSRLIDVERYEKARGRA